MAALSVIHEKINDILEPKGFESYPFNIGCYNDQVDKPFKFHYPSNTLAFVIISTPSMFEKAFVPFVRSKLYTTERDPLDQCMTHYFNKIIQAFPNEELEYIQDFELTPTRRPKVLVQTAGHVSGAVYYYQRSDVKNDPWDPKKKICGVCLHPKYGGWFALRSIIIFKAIQIADLQSKKPVDILQDDESKIKLLEQFNYHWQDWSFRDVIPVQEKYSEQQRLYFATLPKDRWTILSQIKEQTTEFQNHADLKDLGHAAPHEYL